MNLIWETLMRRLTLLHKVLSSLQKKMINRLCLLSNFHHDLCPPQPESIWKQGKEDVMFAKSLLGIPLCPKGILVLMV